MALKAIGRKLMIGTGVGVLDVVTETADSHMGFTKPFQNISDIIRGVATIGGYAYNAMSSKSMANLAGDLAMVYEPLLIRSIWQKVAKVNLLGFSNPRMGIQQIRAGQGYASTVPPAIAPPATAPSKGYRTFVPG